MKVTYRQIRNIAVTLFLTVALNSDWNSNALLWWGSVFFAFGMHCATHGFRVSFRITPFKLWFLAFFGVCLISVLFAINPETSLNTIKSLAVFMVMLFMMDEEIQSRQELEEYIKMYMAAAFVMMVYVALNVELASFQLAQRGLAATGRWNGNDVGLKCAAFLIYFLYFFEADKRIRTRILLLVGGLLALVILYFTASRKAVLIVALGLAMYYYFKHPSKRIRNILIILVSVYAAYLLVLNHPVLYEAIGWRIEGMMALVTGRGKADSSTLLRARYILVGLEAFKKSPIIGYGIDNYRFLNMMETGHLTYSHNNFVEILVGTGVIGFAVYYSYYVKLTVDFLRLYFKKRTSMLLNVTAIGFLSMLIMHIAVVSYSDIMQNLLILFLAKALAIQKTAIRSAAQEGNG